LLFELEKQRLNNNRAQLINKILTFIIIILAFVTLYIGGQSLKFAESDMNSVGIWQQEQIEQLRQSNENFKSILSELKYKTIRLIESQ